MSDHAHRVVERYCDVAVIGGSASGLVAALQLRLERRSVIVVDAGEPDGAEEARRHGCEVLDGAVATVRNDDGLFRVGLTGGHSIVARRVISVADPTLEAVSAADEGRRVGAAVAGDLAAEERRTGAPVSASQLDWDRRYGVGRMWSANPNGALVAEATRLAPGRALDVGAGEGADALWLAEHGWEVTACDISRRALDRLVGEALRRELRVECWLADANDDEPFGAETFDLVSAQYASIARTPDDRAARNLLAAVAPGGVLLVVSHDLSPLRAPIDTSLHSRAFDPDAYVRVDDVASVVADTPGWSVEVHETRPRPPGAASESHHVDDVILRARRDPASSEPPTCGL